MEKLKKAIKELGELATKFFEAKSDDGKITMDEWIALAIEGTQAGMAITGLVMALKDKETRAELIAILSDDVKASEIIAEFREGLDLPDDDIEFLTEEVFASILISFGNIAEGVQRVIDRTDEVIAEPPVEEPPATAPTEAPE